jgi:hypothetical protein
MTGSRVITMKSAINSTKLLVEILLTTIEGQVAKHDEKEDSALQASEHPMFKCTSTCRRLLMSAIMTSTSLLLKSFVGSERRGRGTREILDTVFRISWSFEVGLSHSSSSHNHALQARVANYSHLL